MTLGKEISWCKISNYGPLKLDESRYIMKCINWCGPKGSRRCIHKNQIKFLILLDYSFWAWKSVSLTHLVEFVGILKKISI